MKITGKCHCGNISLDYIVTPDPREIPARVCTCSFCLKHGNVWTASPNGSLRIAIDDADRVHRYAFGTRTAEFHVCAVCGIVPVATSTIDGRGYAVVNVNTFENVEPTLLRRSPLSFDGEGTEDRLARRAKHWIPDVRYVQAPNRPTE